LDPIYGWQSKHYDVKEEANTLVNSGEFDGKIGDNVDYKKMTFNIFVENNKIH